MSVGPHVEKFNILSNDHGRTQKRGLCAICQFSCDPCDPSLGSLEDISPAQIYRAICSLNEIYISPF